MSNIINIPGRDRPDQGAIEAEARAWLVHLDGGRPGRRELKEFREWLDQSPLHREAFRRVASVWNGLDELTGLLGGNAAAGDAARPGLFRPPSYALAAVLVMALVLADAAYLRGSGGFRNDVFAADYATAIGEQRSVVLPDGSQIRMNTASSVDVSYNHGVRLIHLAGGEAWFKVAHNKARPFIVYAGKYAVKAVGTAFSVRVRDDGIDLTITDGRIEVASLKQRIPPQASLDPDMINEAVSRVPLTAGQHAVFNEGIELAQRVEPAQMEKMLSWRDGMLIFDNDTLEDVVAEISRYTPVKIVISDSDIRDMRFGGYFHANDVPSILATLEEGFGIHVEKINNNLIYLSRQQPYN